ncbi:MAG: alpha/beta fold hydrolase [Methanobrevibacter sp.]|nr:alpha/beta fold hydrolase [Methanobrevibacter sp.]
MKVEYTTIGTPIKNEEGKIANGIVYLHGWGGHYNSIRRIADIVGLNKPLDTSKFFIISISTLGTPNSSCPSSTKLANKFPKYSIEDMVNFQIEFLKAKFDINHLKGIIGNSMGGFEALTWASKYPNYMDFLISLVSSYKVAGQNYALFKFMNRIIENDPNYNNGAYLKPLTLATKLANESMYPYGLSSEFYRAESNENMDLAMDMMEEEGAEMDANDIVYRNIASTSYDIEDIISKIKTKTLIVAINQDQYFPPELDAIPMSKIIKNSHLITYDSIMGHIGTSELTKIEKEINEFLKEFK